MIKHLGDWAVLEYEREEDYIPTTGGLLISSKRNQRAMMKGSRHTLSADPDLEIPDLVRCATVVSSKNIKVGTKVLFNKHDGWGFELDKKYLYAIPEAKLMAEVIDK